jgi:hypothetical protein
MLGHFSSRNHLTGDWALVILDLGVFRERIFLVQRNLFVKTDIRKSMQNIRKSL